MTTQDQFAPQEQWYFARLDDDTLGPTPWTRVSFEQFRHMERSAGFYPKGGGDGLATGGFTGANGRQGRIVNPHYTHPDSYEWDPEFQAVLAQEMGWKA